MASQTPDATIGCNAEPGHQLGSALLSDPGNGLQQVDNPDVRQNVIFSGFVQSLGQSQLASPDLVLETRTGSACVSGGLTCSLKLLLG